MIIDQLPALPLPVDDADELPIERGQLTFKISKSDLLGDMETDIGDLQSDVGDLQSDKQELLISGTNIKTVNGTSVLGSGNIEAIPSGGNAGEVLVKNSSANYDAKWGTQKSISVELVSGTTDNYGNILLSTLTTVEASKIINVFSTDHKVFCFLFTDTSTQLTYVKVFTWTEPNSGNSTWASSRNTTLGLAFVYYE